MKRIVILLIVLASVWNCFGTEHAAEIKALAGEQIESRFLKNDRPVRYYSNILILLHGFPSKADSMIFNELVDTLNVLIDKWDVALIPNGTSNLQVEINLPHTSEWKDFSFQRNNNPLEIINSTLYLDLPDTLNFISRKKIIYYHILRSLVVAKVNQTETKKVPGSVFSESEPGNITFHPVDFEIIRDLYAVKYEDKSFRSTNLKGQNRFGLMKLGEVIAIVLALAYLIFVSQRGIFVRHNYEFGEYLKQGILVFCSLLIFIAIYLGSSFLVSMPNFQMMGIGFLIPALIFFGIISLILMYFIERFFLFRRDNFVLEVIVPLVSTLFVPVLLLWGISYLATKQSSSYSLVLITSVFSFVMVIAIARAFYIFMSKKSENIIRKKDLELARMSELHKQAELQSLRAKINPHFLYNALNSIASLATTDARKTEQMALALSDFFKYAINREQKQLNTLSEELNAIRTYLEIEKVRFGDRLSFEIECPEELLNIQIPQLLIQPLVENAIKHGLSQITENGLIRIAASREENQLKIRVYDNGPAFPNGPLSGFGIQNTQERITLLYGARATINWQNGVEKFIEISLPFVNEPVKKD